MVFPRKSRLFMKVCLLLGLGLVLSQSLGLAQGNRSKPEATSLLGKPLYRPSLDSETREKFEEALDKARREYNRAPDHPNRIIWLGRRTAYLGRYLDAIEIYSKGIERYPQNSKLLRHRGHRYITLRRFEEAVQDLEKAVTLIEGKPDQIEPDGLPNAYNIPRSTSHSNIWYHLGLAHYLLGRFEKARHAFQQCLAFAEVNDDMLCATSHWLYMSLRRMGRVDEAAKILEPIKPQMDILENADYHKLLLFYKGESDAKTLLESSRENGVSSATIGYGLANWYLYNRQPRKALALCKEVVSGDSWAAFGYIAAEADLARVP